MYCSKCGKEIHNDAKFCIYCGNKIKKNTPDHSKYEKFDYAPVVLRAEQGDEEAFTTLWAKTNQPYRYYIYLQSKNKDAVDDILQESYRRIFKDIMEKKLQNPEAFFSWGKRIVLNSTADHYRKYKYETQEEKVSESSDDENDIKDFYKEDYATDFNPEAQITQNEVSDILQDIIGELPESQKNCILLWMDEYKTDEIAEILGMSSGTVKSNVNYAKKKIKTKVEDLEKQGVKLYSMAPFTFFVWLMAQFDQNAAFAAPSTGNTVLFEQIMKQVHTIANTASGGSISGQVGNKLNETTSQSLEDAKQAVPQNSGQTASSTSDIGTQPAGQMQNASGNSEVISNVDNAANMAQNAAGNAAKKKLVSTIAGKIVIGVVSIVIITACIFGVFYYRHAQETPITNQIKKEESNDKNKTKDTDQLPTTSKKLSELIDKQYIGNQLYYYESNPQVPIGCIDSISYDIDDNGTMEIISIENNDSDFSFKPTLNIYSSNNGVVKKEDSIDIDLNVNMLQINSSLSDEMFIQKYVKFYCYNNQIVLQYENDSNANDPIFKEIIYTYKEKKLTHKNMTNLISNQDLHKNGIEFCSIFLQQLPTSTIADLGGSSVWLEKEHKIGYLISFINYMELVPMESDSNKSFCDYYVPPYYADFYKLCTIGNEESSQLEDILIYTKYDQDIICFTNIDFGKDQFDDYIKSQFDSESDGFPFSSFNQDKVIYLDKNTGKMIIMNFCINGTNRLSNSDIRSISELTSEGDLKDLSILIMLFSDSNEIPYHLKVH